MRNIILIVVALTIVSLGAVTLNLRTSAIGAPCSSTTYEGHGATGSFADDVCIPEPKGGFWDSVLGAFRYAWAAISGLISLVAFGLDIPPMVSAILITPIAFGLIYVIVRIVRGGG